jgi:hypothetical protein
MPDLTGDERHAPEHSSTHGVQATLPKERVTASCWNTTPFIAPVTSAWDIRLESEQTQTLMIGLCPRAMEDRWFVYAQGPDADGRISVNMHLSWTGTKALQLEIMAGEKPHITHIIWESDTEAIKAAVEGEIWAKRTAMEVCRFVLGVKLRRPRRGAARLLTEGEP